MAAVSVSTLTAGVSATLTTTLKLMAWIKNKTTLIAVAAAVLFLGVGTVGVVRFLSGAAPPANFEGAWEGTIDVGEASLRLVAKLRRAENAVPDFARPSPWPAQPARLPHHACRGPQHAPPTTRV